MDTEGYTGTPRSALAGRRADRLHRLRDAFAFTTGERDSLSPRILRSHFGAGPAALRGGPRAQREQAS